MSKSKWPTHSFNADGTLHINDLTSMQKLYVDRHSNEMAQAFLRLSKYRALSTSGRQRSIPEAIQEGAQIMEELKTSIIDLIAAKTLNAITPQDLMHLFANLIGEQYGFTLVNLFKQEKPVDDLLEYRHEVAQLFEGGFTMGLHGALIKAEKLGMPPSTDRKVTN